MQIVPLQAIPNQTVTIVLNDQVCQIDVYQLTTGLFVDLYVNSVLLVGGAITENLNPIVRYGYLGFSGELAFIDNQTGTSGVGTDPIYTGLGGRYSLAYIEPSDFLANGA